MGRVLHDTRLPGLAALKLHETARGLRASAQQPHNLDGVQRHAAQPAQLQRRRVRALQRRKLCRGSRPLDLSVPARRGECAVGSRPRAHP